MKKLALSTLNDLFAAINAAEALYTFVTGEEALTPAA